MWSAARSLSWEVLARQRWTFVPACAYLFVLVAVAQLLPAETIPLGVAVTLLLPLTSAVVWALGAFSYGFEGRLEDARSLFPARMFALPLSTAALVGWPMLTGALVMALGWLLCARGVLWPWGMEAPLLWPALLFAAVVAWLQAIAWAPFGVPYLRILVAVVVLASLPMGTVAAVEEGAPAGLVAAALAGALPLAYLVAVRGVARARCGEDSGLAWPGWLTRAPSAAPARPFPSSSAALFWLEWRTHGKLFLIATPLCALAALPLLHFAAKNVAELARLGLWPPLTALVELVGPAWVAVLQLLLVPILMTMMCCELGRLNPEGQHHKMSSFVAVRPVTTASLVWAKLKFLALAFLGTWALLVLTVASWAVLAGHSGEMAAGVEALGGPWGWGKLALVLVALLVLNGAHSAAGLWIGLAGRKALVAAVGCGGAVLLTAVSLAAQWAFQHPEHREFLRASWPWVIGALVGLKLLLAGWLLRRNLRAGLLSGAAVSGALAAWVALVIALFGLAAWLVPSEWVSRGALAGGAVLTVPLARCALAPLALAWNRHR